LRAELLALNEVKGRILTKPNIRASGDYHGRFFSKDMGIRLSCSMPHLTALGIILLINILIIVFRKRFSLGKVSCAARWRLSWSSSDCWHL
jgi:hypothetical protein